MHNRLCDFKKLAFVRLLLKEIPDPQWILTILSMVVFTSWQSWRFQVQRQHCYLCALPYYDDKSTVLPYALTFDFSHGKWLLVEALTFGEVVPYHFECVYCLLYCNFCPFM